ncbi:hypothetical protein [Kosakonia sp.]|uniref:hypothetical protein n=1 Tax=Kosakonia sp. TaxID=1916651 RepID=UPI0028A834D3|nr:hypothetical protein [Kosakonia sp.]
MLLGFFFKMHIDNSAQTLRSFLTKLRQQDQGLSTKKALINVFDIPESPERDSILWEKIAKFMCIPQKINETIQDYFPDEEIPAPNWRPSLHQFFTCLNLNEPLQNALSRVSDAALNDLGMLSILFKTKGQVGKLKTDKIQEIMQQLLELKKSVMGSEFEVETRKDILHYINNMIRAFEDYELTGIEPIISATEATMGHACMSEPFNKMMKTTETGSKLKDIVKTTVESINRVEGLVSLGANGLTLLEYFNK